MGERLPPPVSLIKMSTAPVTAEGVPDNTIRTFDPYCATGVNRANNPPQQPKK